MTSTTRAQAHAKHAYWCTCGRVVRGNGAKYQHEAMHRRRRHPAHHYVTREDYELRVREDLAAQAEAEG